eukprot:GHVP01032083.1.p1 GENE.GHVP01032083.1~~GHVP01032083.1.p1  ORF type:complete len:103 (+),score=14.74 GHVP01032083.1:987-1295(+)
MPKPERKTYEDVRQSNSNFLSTPYEESGFPNMSSDNLLQQEILQIPILLLQETQIPQARKSVERKSRQPLKSMTGRLCKKGFKEPRENELANAMPHQDGQIY